MKLSLNWLNQYLSTKLTAEEAADILTRVGLEVEASETFESVKGGMKGIVIGEVVGKSKHPDADRLSVTKVNIGSDELLQIVCGAPNVDTGQKVVVATPGTVLYSDSGEKLEIKRSKIRGVESQGMICAEDEIGVGKSHDGIIVLPADVRVGSPAAEFFNVETDTVLEVNITPNRVDAASHIGAARDVAAFLRLKDPSAQLELYSLDKFKPGSNEISVEIIIDNKQDCPRYSGVVIDGITVKDSPPWLQNKLRSVGLKPVNNVVDVTNYVLFEMGHPLHAFDLSRIQGNRIVIRNVEQDTTFVTLDNVERKLDFTDLMICNADAPMCIAGVFGGLESGVNETTNAVFIESAYFNPVAIRKTAKRHGLHTDASFRFERGADPAITIDALKRAASLICEVAGGKVASAIVDVYPEEILPLEVRVDLKKVNSVAGQDIPEEIVVSILHSLGISIRERSGNILTLAIPTNKVDVTREIDVIEEIMRIYGYDSIQLHDSLHAVIGITPPERDRKLKNRVASLLVSNGFFETLTNSLAGSVPVLKSELFEEHQLVKIQNPISSELDIMRRSMLFSGLEAMAHNINHRITDLKLFEFGKVYLKNASDEMSVPRDRYGERQVLAIFLTGMTAGESWYSKPGSSDFFAIKGAVESLFRFMEVPVQETVPMEDSMFDKGFAIFSFRDKNMPLVRLGMVKPSLCKLFDVKQPVWYAECNWDLVLKIIPSTLNTFSDIPKFPSVRRDLALLLDKSMEYRQIRDWAFKTDRQFLKEVNLFDVYEGKNIPEGKKSYAVSFRFQDKNKTLTDAEVEKIMEKLMKTYSEQLGAEVRSQ